MRFCSKTSTVFTPAAFCSKVGAYLAEILFRVGAYYKRGLLAAEGLIEYFRYRLKLSHNNVLGMQEAASLSPTRSIILQQIGN